MQGLGTILSSSDIYTVEALRYLSGESHLWFAINFLQWRTRNRWNPRLGRSIRMMSTWRQHALYWHWPLLVVGEVLCSIAATRRRCPRSCAHISFQGLSNYPRPSYGNSGFARNLSRAGEVGCCRNHRYRPGLCYFGRVQRQSHHQGHLQQKCPLSTYWSTRQDRMYALSFWLFLTWRLPRILTR